MPSLQRDPTHQGLTSAQYIFQSIIVQYYKLNRSDPLVHSSGVGAAAIYHLAYNFVLFFNFSLWPVGGAGVCLRVEQVRWADVSRDQVQRDPARQGRDAAEQVRQGESDGVVRVI